MPLQFEDGSVLKLSAVAGFVALAIAGAAPPPPPPGSLELTPALTIGYMNASNERQWAPVVSGVTAISGVAPFSVEFFGGDTRSTETDANTDTGAFWNVEYVFDYGEGQSGNWQYSGRPKDLDRGFPMAGHTFTIPGTHTVRMWCYHPAAGVAVVSFTATVAAPVVDVQLTPGVIPDFVDGTVYGAEAGEEWGDITDELAGCTDVTVVKTGTGADPIFGIVNLDNRQHPDSAITRSNGIRFWNCDVARVTWGDVGVDYCTFVGGRVRAIDPPPTAYWGEQATTVPYTAQQTNNIRVARGVFLQSTGEINPLSTSSFVMYGICRGLHVKDVFLHRSAPVVVPTSHNVRMFLKFSSFRHCLFSNPQIWDEALGEWRDSGAYQKLQGSDCNNNADLNLATPDPWQDDDRMVALAAGSPTTGAGGRVLGLPGSVVANVDNFYGTASDGNPHTFLEAAPENNDTPIASFKKQGVELIGYEYCRMYRTTQPNFMVFQGRGVGMRQCYLNSGAGAPVDATESTGTRTNRVPVEWDGPVFLSGARPLGITV